jgi:hypothetical protein
MVILFTLTSNNSIKVSKKRKRTWPLTLGVWRNPNKLKPDEMWPNRIWKAVTRKGLFCQRRWFNDTLSMTKFGRKRARPNPGTIPTCSFRDRGNPRKRQQNNWCSGWGLNPAPHEYKSRSLVLNQHIRRGRISLCTRMYVICLYIYMQF